MSESNSKTPIGLTVWATPPPKWRTRDDVFSYLGGEYIERIECLEDLAMAGVVPPWGLVHDLAEVVQAAVAFIQKPGKLDINDQSGGTWQGVQELADCLNALSEKMIDCTGFETSLGPFDVCRNTLTLLAGNVAHAASEYGENAAFWWDRTMEHRRGSDEDES